MLRPHIWIAEERQVTVLWTLAGLGAILMIALNQLAPPGGWVPLEFPALTDPASPDSPASWTQAERETSLFGLGLDFLFLMVYPLFLSLLCGRAAGHWNLPSGLARVSVIFSTLALLAAPLDALENIGLYLLIKGETGTAIQWFITAVAASKWVIALAASVVGLLCIGFKLKK